MMYCPWCGTPIPNALIFEHEGQYSLHEKKIVCPSSSCLSASNIIDFGTCDIKTIAEILEEAEKEGEE